MDYIDQTGHGIPLIVKNYGKNAFYISEHTVIVTIPLNKKLLDNIKDENIFVDLSEAENKILSLIKNNNEYKTSDLIRLTNYSESYINKILRLLKEKEYIKHVGANKNGHWNVLK